MLWSNIRRIDDEASNVAKFVFTNGSAVSEAVLYRYPDYKTRISIARFLMRFARSLAVKIAPEIAEEGEGRS